MSTRPRGPRPGWRPSTPRQAGILADVLGRYEQHEREGTLPRGGRGIFYDLRPGGLGNGVTYRKPDSLHPVSGFGPMEAHPAAVQEVLVLARRAGLVREGWVADTRAPAPLAEAYELSAEGAAAGVADYAARLAEGFRLDPQGHQAQYAELWCEAEDLSPRLARVAAPYGVPVYSGAGFDGLKGKRALAARAVARGVPTVIFHVGDRDPHGERIFSAVSEDALAWATASGHPSGWLRFGRLALTAEQAARHGLLDSDGKAEADSLPVPVLDAIVTGALESLFDPAGREAVGAEQSEQLGLLPAAIAEALRGWGRDA